MGKLRIKLKKYYGYGFFTGEYIVIYSTNGIFWSSIRISGWNIGEEFYRLHPLTVFPSGVDAILDKFKTIDDIKRFEANEKKKVKDSNFEMDKSRKQYEEQRKRILVEANEKLKQ